MRNRPEIDGLRAVAVLPVLFYHARIGCPGGFVGVDVFFVISGYLITRLILSDLEGGTFSISNFWERRIRRIMPALVVVVLASLVAGWALLLPKDFMRLGQSAVAQATLVSNLYFWHDSGYFAPASETKPLLHTWSLAVEEQFYLLFPVFLVAVKRWVPHLLARVILFLCALSFGLNVYLSYTHESVNFYFLPPRAWELLVGSYLASRSAQQQPSSKWLRETLSCCGLVMIAFAVFRFDENTRFPGINALLPCGGAALVIWTNEGARTWMGTLLATRPFVLVGLISYSLYLWHWPILVFCRYWMLDELSLLQKAIILSVSFGLAILSWRYVENPFRKRVFLKRRSHAFAFAGAAAALILIAGIMIQALRGLPSRFPREAQHYADAVDNKAPTYGRQDLKDAIAGNFGELGVGDKRKPIRLLLWGDSHAQALSPALDKLLNENSARGMLAKRPGTAPLVGFVSTGQYALREDSIPWNDAIVEYVRREQVSDVVLAARWFGYLSYPKASDPTNTLRRCLLETVAVLRGAGARIWIVKDVPEHPWDVPRALARTVAFGGDPDGIGLPLVEHLKRSQLEDLIFEGVARPGVTILDPTPFFIARTNLCRVAEGGNALYSDFGHLSVDGANMLKPLFEPILRSW